VPGAGRSLWMVIPGLLGILNWLNLLNPLPVLRAPTESPVGPMDKVTAALSAVGLGTVPSWLRPYSVLSTGEKFRAEFARILLSRKTRIVIDEFTSVVDRQIARIGAHAFARAWRRSKGRQVILLGCHRDIVEWAWTVKMGDRVTGGTVYWLSDNIDAGDIAAQHYSLVEPGETAAELWRYKLFPLGVELFRKVLRDLAAGTIVAVPQDDDLATWEPSWERAPLRRPDLLMIGQGLTGYTVEKSPSALRH
jgi:hypothetical protein